VVGIDNVVYQQHLLACNAGGGLTGNPDLAGAFLAVAIAGHLHKLDLWRESLAAECPCKICNEHEAALEQSDNDEVAVDSRGDTARQLLHSPGDLPGVE
jgi:hypothetical protein